MSNTACILSETGITYRTPVFTPSPWAFWWSPCHLFTFRSCVDFLWEWNQKLRNGKQFLLLQNYDLANRGMCVNAYLSITLGDALFTVSPDITFYVFCVVVLFLLAIKFSILLWVINFHYLQTFIEKNWYCIYNIFFLNKVGVMSLWQLKPNCPGMIIGRSSTKFMFFMEEGIWTFSHRVQC
jgi:hypothetical protein